MRKLKTYVYEEKVTACLLEHLLLPFVFADNMARIIYKRARVSSCIPKRAEDTDCTVRRRRLLT